MQTFRLHLGKVALACDTKGNPVSRVARVSRPQSLQQSGKEGRKEGRKKGRKEGASTNVVIVVSERSIDAFQPAAQSHRGTRKSNSNRVFSLLYLFVARANEQIDIGVV